MVELHIQEPVKEHSVSFGVVTTSLITYIRRCIKCSLWTCLLWAQILSYKKVMYEFHSFDVKTFTQNEST